MQRKCDEYWRAQERREWGKEVEGVRSIDNAEFRVGVMGLGKWGVRRQLPARA